MGLSVSSHVYSTRCGLLWCSTRVLALRGLCLCVSYNREPCETAKPTHTVPERPTSAQRIVWLGGVHWRYLVNTNRCPAAMRAIAAITVTACYMLGREC